MSQLQEALDKLGDWKKTGNGRFAARCPVPGHGKGKGDKGPSLSVGESADGKLLLYCHAGCSFVDVVRALGLENGPPEEKRIVAEYDYRDKDGTLRYQVVRYEPKDFRQRHWEDGKWVWNLSGVKPILFNLAKVMQAKSESRWIILVEGEKDVMTLAAHDIDATATSGGAKNKWKAIYTQALTGAKVAIIPDNDDTGREYAGVVAAALHGWAQQVKVLELDTPVGGDVTDWFHTEGNDRTLLARILNETPDYRLPYNDPRVDGLFDMVKGLVRDVEFLKGRRARRDGV